MMKSGYSSLSRQPAAIDLSLGINPFGFSHRARAAIENCTNAAFYPDPKGECLKAQLSDKFSLRESNILIGAGADELIYSVIGALVFLGYRELITTEYVFPNVRHAARVAGLQVHMAAYNPGNYDEAIKNIMNQKNLDKIPVFLCNPSCPFGEIADIDDLHNIVAGIDAPVIVDEAALEFSEARTALDNSLVSENLIILRSFSKGFGLAGMRIGWAAANFRMVHTVENMRWPFVTSSLAHHAAMAALTDSQHVSHSYIQMNKESMRLQSFLIGNDIKVYPSASTFFVADFSFLGKGHALDIIFNELNIRLTKADDFHSSCESTANFRISPQNPQINRNFCLKLQDSFMKLKHFT